MSDNDITNSALFMKFDVKDNGKFAFDSEC